VYDTLAVTPLSETTPFWLAPKPEPLIPRVPPTGPAGGAAPAVTGFTTVNSELEVLGLVIEFTVTVTGPVPTGTPLERSR